MTELSTLNRVRQPGCQGIKIFGGRSANNVALGVAGSSTYETAIELDARSAQAVGSLAPIIAAAKAASGSAEVGVFAYVDLIAELSALDSAWGGVAVDFWGTGASRLPVSPSTVRRAFLTTDQAERVPPSRSDGRTKPLAACRAAIGATTLQTLGNGSDSFSNWSSRPAGYVRFRANSGSGDQSTATSGWSTASTGLCVGFAYSHLGPILNVMLVGDSIGEGRGTYLNEGFGQLAVDALNAQSPLTWLAYSNLSWSGGVYTTIRDGFFDALAAGIIPDVLVFPCGTLNDVGAGSNSVTAAHVNNWRARLAQMLAKCAEELICPIVYSIPPVNNAANGGSYDLGASDSLRVAYNAEIKALCAASGITFIDIDASAYAGSVSSGQVQISAGLTTDYVHPNDAGNAVIGALLQSALITVAGGYL